MTTAQRIIVPLDGSPMAEQAIPYAAALAGAGGEVTFLHVVPAPEPLRGLFGGEIATADDVKSMAEQTGGELMEETAGRWQQVLATQPGVLVLTGDPAEATLDAIESTGATMLALSSHGRGMAGRVAFGSVADRLARTSPVPALIVHPSDKEGEPAAQTIRRLIVPLDGSETANEALPVAEKIAAGTGASILLISAINPSSIMVPSPIGAAYYPSELYEDIASDMGESAKADLSSAQEQLSGVVVESQVIEGPVLAAVESVVEPGDLVVMTSHGRSGFRRWLLGSVSEKLIRSGLVPVVLVPSSARTAATGRDGKE